MVEILYKSENAIVIYKSHGTPSQPDPSGSPDAMSEASGLLRDMGENSDLWLIHRLDRSVSGVMIFARNKESAALLSEQVRERQIAKEYLAVVSGTPEEGTLTDYLFKDSRLSKAFVVSSERKGVKRASLDCQRLASITEKGSTLSLVRITLHTGRFHQIRAQLSSRACPILGDKKYGSRISLKDGIALAAYRLEIDLKDEHIRVTHLPKTDNQPWSLFDSTVYERLNEND